MHTFNANQVIHVLQSYQKKEFTGILQVDVQPNSNAQVRSRLIVFENGAITYVGLNLPQGQKLAQQIGAHLKINNIGAAIQLANKRSKEGDALLDYLALFIKIKLFGWQDFAQFMQQHIAWTLEQILPYPGTAQVTSDQATRDYMQGLPGFSLANLNQILQDRQQKWTLLSPSIPSIEAIPRTLKHPQDASERTLQHFQTCIDGQQSLSQIAYGLGQDPLKLAQTYYRWIQQGWIICEEAVQEGSEQGSAIQPDHPLILSVDDSSVVQTMIKRAICDRYQVLLANNAVDALNILNSKAVSLILLDVTMPDIDGLDLCRTIRSISKFRDLPVVMLTAKDGMFNKLKGQMAGSTHYLTKPISRDKLLEVLDKYISAPVHA